jgi:hypothetical protein
MAVITGQRSSYDNTAILKRVVTDRIVMAEPMEFPLLKALGINNKKFNFVNEPGSKYEWVEDTYAPEADAANDADLTSTSTLTTFTVAHGEYFHVGDVIKIDDEYMWVSAISSDDITVTRNFSGTQATHDSDATILIVSQARKEGADASDSPTTEASTAYNYSFIMHKNVEVSRSNALFKRYGIANAVDYEIDKGMDELMRILTKKPYYGTRAEGDASTPRDAGGFDTFITTNLTNASSARLSRSHLEDLNRDIYDAGGLADLIICGAFQQQIISDMFEGYVTTERSEQMGGVTIKKIQMALGNVVSVLVDRYCPTSSLWMLDTEKVGFIDIDPFFYEDLGKVGDTAAYGEIVGEYGFVVEVEDHHGKIYGLATS